MRDELPEVYAQFQEIAEQLERHYRDMQDLEFTVERGTLYMLQTRTGKRTAPAAVKIAVDMVNEGLIDAGRGAPAGRAGPDRPAPPAALRRGGQGAGAGPLLGKGLNASPGAAVGKAVFDADRAGRAAQDAGDAVILVRLETIPDDVTACWPPRAS